MPSRAFVCYNVLWKVDCWENSTPHIYIYIYVYTHIPALGDPLYIYICKKWGKIEDKKAK